MKSHTIIAAIACCLLSVAVTADGSGTAGDMPTAEGLIQFDPPQPLGCIATRVAVPVDKMVVGMQWHNGSATGSLPKILVANGNGSAPPSYSEAVSVAEDVHGQDQGMSEATFSSPVASETGTMFIIVEYPPNYAAPAEGPALGVGYVREGGDAGKQAAHPYFVTGDGETWIGVSSRCRVLLDPILVDRTPEAVVFRGPAKAKQDIPVQKLGLYAAPNPFNPQTTVALYLKGATTGDLKIYDIRGRLVTVLYTGPLVQGANSFTWNGRDSAGRGVASGAYWVQARTSDQSLTIKVMLLR